MYVSVCFIAAHDLCSFRPCYFGTCVNVLEDRSFNFTCDCDEGYTGELCDIGNVTRFTVISIFV